MGVSIWLGQNQTEWNRPCIRNIGEIWERQEESELERYY